MLVVLFDIDGTLISTGGAGGTALMRAFSETFRIENPADVPFSGRTDRGIAAALFGAHGIADTQDNFDRLQAAYTEELPKQLPLHTGCVLAGVEELLTALSELPRIALGLLTGNLRQGARLKLQHYGLADWFPFGGFGDHHLNRDAVAYQALDEVQRVTQGQYQRIVVVGDTPLDIQCARAIDAEVVAVATGIHAADELHQHEPDRLFGDLSNTAAVMEFVVG